MIILDEIPATKTHQINPRTGVCVWCGQHRQHLARNGNACPVSLCGRVVVPLLNRTESDSVCADVTCHNA